MARSSPALPILRVERLRMLTLDARDHPRGQPHLSAASGLVCSSGRALVIADDEHHLAIFDDLTSPGRLHNVVAGRLPEDKGERKRRKADFESLFSLPAATLAQAGGHGALVGLGSGSRPNRRRGVLIALASSGLPSRRERVRVFDLEPLYAPLASQLGEALNIEGAFLRGGEMLLLQRGGRGSENFVLRYAIDDLLGVLRGDRRPRPPRSLRRYRLGDIGGVALGFTDGAALGDGRWVFSAAAETSDDAYADGSAHGSAVGVVAADGRLLALHLVQGGYKVEGIDARLEADGHIALAMVTDADDPDRASCMLRARL